jgi:hypothetical protein
MTEQIRPMILAVRHNPSEDKENLILCYILLTNRLIDTKPQVPTILASVHLHTIVYVKQYLLFFHLILDYYFCDSRVIGCS